MCFEYFRNLLGEDLGPLSSKDLEQLERQLDSSLKHVRSTKVFFSSKFIDKVDFSFSSMCHLQYD